VAVTVRFGDVFCFVDDSWMARVRLPEAAIDTCLHADDKGEYLAG
jgi:hypothetical protein